jgi:type IV secretory pathway TraG/TraD family ATPase VirD4
MSLAFERAWAGQVRVAGERARLLALLAVFAGTLTGGLWLVVSTWGPGQRLLVDYARLSFQAASGATGRSDVRIGDEVFRDAEPERLRRWMRERYYGGRSFADLGWEFVRSGAVGAVAAVTAALAWARRGGSIHQGEVLRGSNLLTPARLNRELRSRARATGDTMGLSIGAVRLSRRAEASHVLLLGDSGAGKSSTIRSILAQIRDQPAIVYDPEREFLADFFVEGVDTVLNPFDARSPFWSPWAEVASSADMEALAMSFVPEPAEEGGNAKFWVESARTLFVALLERCQRRHPHEISRLLQGPTGELCSAIRGTPAANAVSEDAPQQAQGVIATLGIAARALRMLRSDEAGVPHFSAVEWAHSPTGWVFLCSTERARKATLPLSSVWLDCLVRPLLDADLQDPKPVWVVADELQTLQRLATLPDLLTRGRKRGLRCVLGAQSMAQFEALYGTHAKTLLSQPMTKLIFRCSEPETAKWGSELIGAAERVTHRASVSVSGSDSLNLSDERHIDAIVLPSEIQKLPNLKAYLVHAGLAARIATPLVDRLHRVPDFVPRPD